MNKIKELREKNRVTQQKLAEAMKVTQGTVSQWERGETFPRADKLPQLAQVLGCTINDLFNGGEEDEI